jgi:hypothetical protein
MYTKKNDEDDACLSKVSFSEEATFHMSVTARGMNVEFVVLVCSNSYRNSAPRIKRRYSIVCFIVFSYRVQ